jgi:hypothetical protein
MPDEIIDPQGQPPETPPTVEPPVTTPENQEQQEVWKDGKPFNAEWAAKKIEQLTNENKNLKPKAKRADELEAEAKKRADAELSETERLKKENEEIKAENARTQDKILRREVIDEVGLPATFASRLQGATKEELLADAKELAKTLPQLKTAPKVPPTNPGSTTPANTEAELRRDLFGGGSVKMDKETIERLGGGVVWNNKPLTKE